MNEELHALLSTIANTYHDVMPVGQTTGITYTQFNVQDATHESGVPLGEAWSYMVRVFQTAYNQSQIDAVCALLRGAGWSIGPRGPVIRDDARTHYMYPIEINKWRGF